MQILIKITNLPEGSSAGPIFNIIPNVGTANPSTAYINDLTGDGVLVIVDDGATSITLESTGLCTNAMSADIQGFAPLTICAEVGLQESATLDSYEMQYMGDYNGSAWYSAPLNNLPPTNPLVINDFPDNVYISFYYNAVLERWEGASTIGPPTLPISPQQNITQIYASEPPVQGFLPPVDNGDNLWDIESVPFNSFRTPFFKPLYESESCIKPKLCASVTSESGILYSELENQGLYNGKYWYIGQVSPGTYEQIGFYYDGTQWVGFALTSDAPVTSPPVDPFWFMSINNSEGFGLIPPENDWEPAGTSTSDSIGLNVVSSNPLICSGLCLTTSYEAAFFGESRYENHQPTITGILNGQPIYRYGDSGGDSFTFLIWSGTRWEFRNDSVTGEVQGYLSTPYNTGDPVPAPVGVVGGQWVGIGGTGAFTIRFNNEFYNVVITSLGQCCSCATIGTEEGSPSEYIVSYIDCTGESASVTLGGENDPTVNICTLNPFSLEWPEEEVPTFKIYINSNGCTSETTVDDPPITVYLCDPICVTFIGGDEQSPYQTTNVLAYPTGSFLFGKSVYEFQTPTYPSPAPPPTTLFIYWRVGTTNSWVIGTNPDDDPIYILETVIELDSPQPIGLSWKRSCLNPEYNFGSVITRLSCDDPFPACMCATFIPNDPEAPLTTAIINYIDCEGNEVIGQEIEITYNDGTSFVHQQCVKFGETPTITSGDVTLQILKMCDPSLNDNPCSESSVRPNECI